MFNDAEERDAIAAMLGAATLYARGDSLTPHTCRVAPARVARSAAPCGGQNLAGRRRHHVALKVRSREVGPAEIGAAEIG
jgi:hypothetical protein